jgi:tetratricopeptide (TPR) repeat protein
MIHGKKFIKIIAVLVIITFIWQGDLFLYAKDENGLDDLFYKARNEYNNMQYVTSKKRLEEIVGEIKEKVLGRKDILGKCYLLLGAIYEKEEKTNLARENYRKAIGDYEVQAIDGVNLSGLVILEKVIKEPRQPIVGKPGVIDRQFNIARDEYADGKYLNAKERLERIIGIIHEKSLTRDDIMGKCYLLLGAVYEKENKELLAEENYQKAKAEYDTSSIDGVDDLARLTIYRRVVKGEEVLSLKGQIEKEGKKIKKKFPWLLVAGGVVVIVVAAILLLKKKKKKYTLTVNLGKGVKGTPESTTTYPKGSRVNYSYSLKPGYTNLVVTLDGNVVPSNDTITMNTDYTLTANATANVVDFVTDKDEVSIDEGNTSTFRVRLSAQPTDKLETTVSWESGDQSIRVVSGGNLTFDTSNWNDYQTVTLEALEDDADASNGQATIRISAPGIQYKDITVTEIDNDSLNFVTNTDKIDVEEGSTAIFRVRLSSKPSSEVSANISRVRGDSDISVSSGSSLTFDSANWDKYQDVTLAAVKDDDALNGVATIRISAPPETGITHKEITATEVDNYSQYTLTVTKGAGVDGTPDSGTTTHTADEEVSYSYTLQDGYSNLVVQLDGEDVPHSGTITMNENHTLTATATPIGDYTLIVSRGEGVDGFPESGTTTHPAGEEVSYSYSLQAGYSNLVVELDGTKVSSSGTFKMDGNHTLTANATTNEVKFRTDKDKVTVPEGGTAEFRVKLSAKPSSNVVTSVSFIKQKTSVNYRTGISPNSSSEVAVNVKREGGDKDISVISGSSLTFDSTNWDKYKTVKLQAAQDNDTENGKATIRISAPGTEIKNKDIIATEQDNYSPGNLLVTPDEGFYSYGPVGGTFSPSSEDYKLENTGSTSIDYTISNNENWLTVSSTEGSLAAGESTTVTVEINENANSLTESTYNDTITFTNTTNGIGNTTRSVALAVGSIPGNITVTPSEGFSSSGQEGGPFDPSSNDYTLVNTGVTSIEYTISKKEDWLTVSSTGGTLAAGESTIVKVEIHENANGLSPNIYNDIVTFTNTTNGNGNTTRSVTLTVTSAPNPGNLSVTPDEAYSPSGQKGGPFNPSSKDYILENTGDTSIDYTVSKNEDWLTLSSTGGLLAPGETKTVTVEINESNANSLSQGTYEDTVIFTNTTNNKGDTTRTVTLTVNSG